MDEGEYEEEVRISGSIGRMGESGERGGRSEGRDV